VKIDGIIILRCLGLELRVNREKEITMSKFLQNSVSLSSVAFGALALVTLVSATPVTPAHAQSAPAGLLRLDPPQPSRDIGQLADDQRTKVRAAYAHVRKSRTHQQ
jgi:hypothetical protein